MRSLSYYRKGYIFKLNKTAFAFLCALLINIPVGASEKLTKLDISDYGNNSISLFPNNKISDFNVTMDTPEILNAEIYDLSLEEKNKVILEPHPKVKYMRINQVSNSPDVVRATLVFNEPLKVNAKKIDNKIIIETTPTTESKNNSLQSNSKIDKNSQNYDYSQMDALFDNENSQTILDQKLSLDFEQEDLLTLLDAIAAKFNLRVFADSGVKGKVSLKAQDVTLREILKNLLLNRNYQYTLKGRNLTVISFDTTSNKVAKELLFRDLNLKDSLQVISKMMNINLIIHESVEDKKVNFYVENLSLDELFNLLIETNGLVKKHCGGNTYVVCKKESASEFGEKVYRTFKLVNSKPQEIIDMIKNNKALGKRINAEGFSVNERINSISVYEAAENINLIEKIIKSADEKLKQAVIEVKLVEIDRKGLKQLGINFENNSENGSDIGRLPSNYSLPAKLENLEQKSKAKILASPKIRALHGKKASINIGKVIPVPYYNREKTNNSNYGSSTQSQKEYKDVQVGIRLEVTPEISRDNEISMELNTSIDSVLGFNHDGQITKSERNTNTYIRVKNGETVIIGGLIDESGYEPKKNNSFMSKVPILKGFTSRPKSEINRTEMIMLVTPRLVNIDEDEDDADGDTIIIKDEK